MSPPPFTTETVEPHTLTPEARAALADALYSSHRTVFDGVDRQAFGAYVVDSPADETRILILRDARGVVRGYAALHVFIERHLGRPMIIVRVEIGAEPAFRRCSFAGPFITAEALRLALKYPGRPRYFFASFVHPSAYVSLCRHTPRVWPHPEQPTPPEVQALMYSLQRRWALTPTGDGTVQVGWIARACGHAPRRLSPEARFYLERNPGYARGEGLVTIIDFGTAAVVRGALDYLGHHLRRRWRRAVQTLPIGLGERSGPTGRGAASREPAAE